MRSTPYLKRSTVYRVYKEILEFLRTTYGHTEFVQIPDFHLRNAIATIRGHTVIGKWREALSNLGLIKPVPKEEIDKVFFEIKDENGITRLVTEEVTDRIVANILSKHMHRPATPLTLGVQKIKLEKMGIIKQGLLWKMFDTGEFLEEIERAKGNIPTKKSMRKG